MLFFVEAGATRRYVIDGGLWAMLPIIDLLSDLALAVKDLVQLLHDPRRQITLRDKIPDDQNPVRHPPEFAVFGNSIIRMVAINLQ